MSRWSICSVRAGNGTLTSGISLHLLEKILIWHERRHLEPPAIIISFFQCVTMLGSICHNPFLMVLFVSIQLVEKFTNNFTHEIQEREDIVEDLPGGSPVRDKFKLGSKKKTLDGSQDASSLLNMEKDVDGLL